MESRQRGVRSLMRRLPSQQVKLPVPTQKKHTQKNTKKSTKQKKKKKKKEGKILSIS